MDGPRRVAPRLRVVRSCPNCGAEVAGDARFCPSCGRALPRICRSCGADLPDGARFCPTCGTPVTGPPGGGAATDGGSAPAEERKVVTVLFADVTGSTTLGEGLDPEPLREVFDAYFTAMRDEIEAEGGTVEKFIGDAVVAVFGVPVAHEDDPARALRAATRMLSRLDQVNVQLEREYDLSLRIRIGVNTGEVLASPDAAPGEPLATGDVMNTAARLQAAAEPDAVLVADRTARAVRRFRFAEPSTLSLRGRSETVIARRLLGVREPDDREAAEIGAPMIGRDRELTLLSAVFEGVAEERRPHLVTIYGDPGVGKSRLTREFVRAAGERAEDPAILVGRCLPYGEGVTYWPLAEILKARAGIRDSDPIEVVLARLDAVLADLPSGIDPARLRAAFAATLGLEDPERPRAMREPKQVRGDLHEAWRSLLSSITAQRPVVVIVEDIHWADDSLLDLLEELAERVEGPVLFICPARPELTERRPTWGGGRRHASSVDLAPLGATEADRLVGLLLEADLPAPVRARILERAEGNPFFIEEIVRHLIDQGTLERANAGWRTASGAVDIHIPDTVQGVLAARIDLLEPYDKRVLQLAAVVGRVFWWGSVAAQLNGDGEALPDALERLRSRDLVLTRVDSTIQGEREFIFGHVLTRDVAYDTLPRRDRAHAHAVVAAWIERMAGGRVREFGELLAHHYAEAYEAERASPQGTPDRAGELRAHAFEALIRAGDEARGRAAIRRAFTLIDRALAIAEDPIERARALEARGHAALSDYRGDDAWRSFKEAVDLRLVHTPDDREAIAYACARAVESPMRWPGSMAQWPDDDVVVGYLEFGLAHASSEPNETLVRLLTAQAFKPFGLSEARPGQDRQQVYQAAVAAGLQAADMAMSIGRTDLASAALDGAASAPIDLGLYGTARETTARRLALAPMVEDPWERGDIYAMAAWENAMLGNVREALAHAGSGRALLQERGAEGVVLHSAAWGTYASFMLGEWDTAQEWATLCERLLGDRRNDPPYFSAQAVCASAMIHRLRGELAELERLQPRIRLLLGDVATHHGQGSARAWAAWLAVRDGDLAQAEELLTSSRRLVTRTQRPLVEIVTTEVLGAAMRWGELPAYLEETRAYASEAELGSLPHHLDRLEARGALAAGEAETAATVLAGAAIGFDALEHTWEAARTRLLLAEAEAARGHTATAREALNSAIPVFEQLRSLDELAASRALRDRVT